MEFGRFSCIVLTTPRGIRRVTPPENGSITNNETHLFAVKGLLTA